MAYNRDKLFISNPRKFAENRKKKMEKKDGNFINTLKAYENLTLMTEKDYRNQAITELGSKLDLFEYIHKLGFMLAVGTTIYIVIIIAIIIGKAYGSEASFEIAIDNAMSKEKTFFIITISANFICLFISTFFTFYRRIKIDNKVREIKRAKKETQINDMVSKNNFDVLCNINIEHLNKYYEQTYDQCDKSFVIAKRASTASYIILAFGIVLFFISTLFFLEERSKLIMFGITTGAGVVIKIISSLYFYMYNTSVKKLSEYHDKLYTVQNILISLELSSQINDPIKKDDIKADMIKRLLESHNEHKHEDIKKNTKAI